VDSIQNNCEVIVNYQEKKKLHSISGAAFVSIHKWH